MWESVSWYNLEVDEVIGTEVFGVLALFKLITMPNYTVSPRNSK